MRKEVTNVFLVKGDVVCLGMKKRGFGVGNWNGTGGKIEANESVEDAAKREAKEEFGVELNKVENVGETLFVFKDGLEIHCHIFVCRDWKGEAVEGEEMAPKWFKINNLPLDSMWSTDISWLPMILDGKKVKGTYYFNDDAKTVERFDLKEIS
jgi:8-oxo-dGTP pyrophosphatase MutT (NUDIX family)